jgi:cell division protein FtsB
MKPLIIALTVLLVVLQYPLWFGSGSVAEIHRLRQDIASQERENARLRDRNQALEAEVVDLKSGVHAIEERARSELGMIRHGETFYQVVGD